MPTPIYWTVESTKLICDLIEKGVLTDDNFDEVIKRCEGHARYDCTYFVASDDVRLVVSYYPGWTKGN